MPKTNVNVNAHVDNWQSAGMDPGFEGKGDFHEWLKAANPIGAKLNLAGGLGPAQGSQK